MLSPGTSADDVTISPAPRIVSARNPLPLPSVERTPTTPVACGPPRSRVRAPSQSAPERRLASNRRSRAVGAESVLARPERRLSDRRNDCYGRRRGARTRKERGSCDHRDQHCPDQQSPCGSSAAERYRCREPRLSARRESPYVPTAAAPESPGGIVAPTVRMLDAPVSTTAECAPVGCSPDGVVRATAGPESVHSLAFAVAEHSESLACSGDRNIEGWHTARRRERTGGVNRRVAMALR
jgi:hypothetical protein